MLLAGAGLVAEQNGQFEHQNRHMVSGKGGESGHFDGLVARLTLMLK